MEKLEYTMNDETIAQIAKILQVAILTGTDIVDNLRQARFTVDGELLCVSADYAEEFNKTVKKLVERVQPKHWFKAYQSQGMIPIPWLGPTVETVLDKIARQGSKTALIVPVGFVCDHVEILFDIDIEFNKYAQERKLSLHRTESLNLSPTFVEALASVTWENLV